MSRGRLLSTTFDEEGRASVVLGIDESDGEDLVVESGAAARQNRKARAAARTAAAAAAPAKVPKAVAASAPIELVAVASAKGKIDLNPFAKPAEISLDDDKVETKKKDDKQSRSRSRDRRKAEKRKKKLAEVAKAMGIDMNADDFDPRMIVSGRMAAAGGKIAVGSDLITGGTAMGPVNIGGCSDAGGQKAGICVKFLTGTCPMTEKTCVQKHVPDAVERQRWIKYFNGQPCKFGGACQNMKCIYEHPNRPGWSGEDVSVSRGATL